MEDFDGLEDGLLRARSPLEDFEVIEGETPISPMEDFEVLGNELPRPITPLIDSDGLEYGLPSSSSLGKESDGIEGDLPLARDPMALDDAEPTDMQIDAAASYFPPEQTLVNEEQTEEMRANLGEKKKKKSVKEEDEIRWSVAKMFFEHRSLVENQLHSFNEFLETGIHKMFKESTPIEVPPDHNPASVRISGFPRQARFWFGEVSVGKPVAYVDDSKKETRVLFPREARLRNMTYSAPINLDIHIEVYYTSTSYFIISVFCITSGFLHLHCSP